LNHIRLGHPTPANHPSNFPVMKNTKDVAHSPKELLDELKALVGEAQSMITGSLSEHSAEALASLRERFSDAQERFGEFYSGAKKQVVAGARCTDTAIRENPYQSIAITLGVGVLVGLLVGRRGK
jgi:ElaB/YqjD/DUF883 family membrane-anchored ribosome-binding protein